METQPVWPLKVLLVEDDVINRKLMSRIFSRLVLEQRDASDGLEALKVLEAWRPDLIVTDLSMPRMDGISLIAELVARGNPPCVVVMSAHHESAILDKVHALLPCRYFYKPIRLEQVETALSEIAGELGHSKK